MRLRNKKTGEIFNGNVFSFGSLKNLVEFNEVWEDYEEPKEFWYIDAKFGIMCDYIDTDLQDKRQSIEFMIGIGNYFDTKEEAEKVVEKLKAWKRLKNKGFRFEGISGISNEIHFEIDKSFNHVMVDEYTSDEIERDYNNDLMLLFGDEE